MRRRWKLVLSAAVVWAVLLVAGLLWLWLRPVPPSARVNAAAFAHIERGMTPAEVEAVIGLPPGDYRSDPASPRHRAEFLPQKGVHVLEWEGDACNIQVKVDDGTGRVLSKICGEPAPSRVQAFLEWAGSLVGR
jgi:hypothetical protein